MILEVVLVVLLLGVGMAAMAAAGHRGWSLPFLGFLAGVGSYVTFGSLQLWLGLPTDPRLTLGLLIIMGVAIALASRSRLSALVRPRPLLALALGVALLVVLLRQARMVRYHWDSLQYLTSAGLLASGETDRISDYLLTARTLAVPLLHAPAHLHGELAVQSIGPMLALATLGALGWFVQQGLARPLGARLAATFSVAAVALVATVQRFQFNAFYINGHLLVAALVLILAGAGWLRLRDPETGARPLVLLQALAIPTLVVARPEGSLLVAILLVPQIATASRSRGERALLLASAGFSITGWHFFLQQRLNASTNDESWVVLMFGLGLVMLLSCLLLPLIDRIGHVGAHVVELGLWSAVLVLAAREPHILVDSVRATARNVLTNQAYWGTSLAYLAVLAMVVLIATRPGPLFTLRFPLSAFIPLVLLLAYLREGAYRANPADSLARMLLHVVPLLVLYVSAAAISHLRSPVLGQPARRRNVQQSRRSSHRHRDAHTQRSEDPSVVGSPNHNSLSAGVWSPPASDK